MTRLPVESWDVASVTGDLYLKYKVPSLCAHPTCSRFSDHVHHICRRSFIIGDVSWVRYGDGPIIGNLCGLCWRHHEEITINKARIIWESRLKKYSWVDEGGVAVGTLYPHPPIHANPVVEEKHSGHIHGPSSDSLCPECQRPLPRPKETADKNEPAKRRKTWSITVPDDTDEDGALVLDTLVAECARLFGREDGGKLRYFVVAQALALVVQNGHLLSD